MPQWHTVFNRNGSRPHSRCRLCRCRVKHGKFRTRALATHLSTCIPFHDTLDAYCRGEVAMPRVCVAQSTLGGRGTIELRPTTAMGLGLFAATPIPRDELLVAYTGERLDAHAVHERYGDTTSPAAVFLLALPGGAFVDGRYGGSLARFANHYVSITRRPNAKLTSHGNIRSVTSIPRGAQITVAYGRHWRKIVFPVTPKAL